MSGKNDLAFMDATAQAALVRKGEVKPSELVEAAIERIERLNPELNAVITPMFDLALDYSKGDVPDGPFKGVPFLLKDLIAEYGGVAMAEGSNFLKGYVPDCDSELVVRQKKAGLIVVGKTNTPEFGILPTTEPHRFGPTKNPWDTGRATGGSSGGSAAAVASGMVAMAHGNDGGGSIRIPSSCCGLFGLKPSRGRNPLGPNFGDVYSGLVCEHALTRSVRDSAALLDATSGPDRGDPYWAPPPKRPFLEEVGADPGRLRIGLVTKSVTDVTVQEDCVKAVREAGALLEELGHNVEDLDLDLDGALITESFITVWAAGIAWDADYWTRKMGRDPQPDEFEPLTRAMVEMGRSNDSGRLLSALESLQKITREVAIKYGDYQVLVTPTLAEPPVPLGSFESTPDNPLFGLMRAAAFVPFTPICNITGQPAMSVPLYWNNDGLPIGVHFIAHYGEDGLLFRLGSQLEEARPWSDRRAKVSA